MRTKIVMLAAVASILLAMNNASASANDSEAFEQHIRPFFPECLK